MEEIDVDKIVDVPDTPDRIVATRVNGVQFGQGSNSSEAIQFRNSDFRSDECQNRPKPRFRLNGENLHGRRSRSHGQGNHVNVNGNKTIDLLPLDNSCLSQKDALFRREAIANNSKCEARCSTGVQRADKGKAVCDKVSCTSPENNSHLDLIKEDMHNRTFGMALPRVALKDPSAKEIREDQISINSNSSTPNSSRISCSTLKGKEKVDVNTSKDSDSATSHGKGVDPSGAHQHKIEKQTSAFCLPALPRISGHKRLVRNGLISPLNQRLVGVAARGNEENRTMDVVSDGLSQVDIKEIVAEDNICYSAKGKGVVIHPLTKEKHDANTTHMSTSSSVNVGVAANETGNASRVTSLDGWRTAHNCQRKMSCPSSGMDGRQSRRGGYAGCFVNERHGHRIGRKENGTGNITKDTSDLEDRDANQRASRLNPTSKPHDVEDMLAERQKRLRLTSRNQGECSRTDPNDSEFMVLGSSRETSSSMSSRIPNYQRQGISIPIYEVDELSPKMRNDNPQGSGPVNTDDSDVRARQVEADEILARELQEQLYNEAPLFGENEIDENIAWALQQDEDEHPITMSQNHPAFHVVTRSTPNLRARRQPENPSNGRRTQVQVPTARASRLRNRLFNRPHIPRVRNHSPAVLPRERTFNFPLGMDLDMRLDILEAIEAAIGDSNDMRITADSIRQVQRDFNENDYEMLLALDENNLRRGASINQINSLPESVVQNDNFEEPCAICLENPTIGETIRHLPCLHKFHKDCIDPWLSRNTSCPVCKSSIT